MIYLALGNEDQTWYVLKGGTGIPGLVGVIYEPAMSAEPIVEERITLTLKGTQEQMDAILQVLEQKLTLAERANLGGIGMPQYLRVKGDPDGQYFQSRILSEKLVPLKNSLTYYSTGSLGVDILFTRMNYFDSDEVQIALTTDPLVGKAIVNHDDSAHDNFIRIDRDDFETELPAPVRFEITDTFATGKLNDLVIGSFQYNLYQSLPKLVYEAESGTGGTSVASGTASGGYFRRFTSTTAGWNDLTGWTVTAEDLWLFEGRSVTPVIRLASAHAYSGLLMKICVFSGGLLVFEGEEISAVASKGFYVFPPVHLPSGELRGVDYPGVQVVHLYLYKPDTTSTTIDIDDLLLIPMDSFSYYAGLIPLSQNEVLFDDAFAGKVYGKQGDYELGTHIGMGNGHFLLPNHACRFLIFQGDDNELAPIDRSLSVRAWYRRRRRIL